MLMKAGLGYKRIQFEGNDTEFDVCHKLVSEFSQLRDCGGFELLKWMSKDRKLVLIEGRWDVKSLKLNIGFQSKMYIRPIQKCLDTTELLQDGETSELKQSCMNCGEEFFVNELRTHVQTCNSDGEIDEESLVKTSNEQDVSDGKTEFETIHVQTLIQSLLQLNL